MPRLVLVLKYVLKKLSKLTVWRYRPGIIGVTGSVGKTSARRTIAAVIGTERRVRETQANLNTELGIPLTVLGEWSKEELSLISIDGPEGKKLAKTFFWLKVLLIGVWNVLIPAKSKYPEILVLEYGADKPGDMRRLLSIVRPDIGVITAVGEIPVHVEAYAGPEEVGREKSKIIEWLPTASFAVLNHDDRQVMSLKDRTRAHVITFGFEKGADMRIMNFEHRMENDRPAGISFKLEYGGSQVPVKIENAFGKAQAYASSVAACIGVAFGMNLLKIAEALRTYKVSEGRANILRGIKDSYVINDTYNASPLSTEAALDTLNGLGGKRKIAILGDMRELGRYSLEAHGKIGRVAAGIADIIVTVGPHGRFMAEAARKARFPKTKLFSFENAEESIDTVTNMVKRGDLILVKASHSMHLDVIADALTAR